jgi:DNA polymerase III delta prime subunit
MFLSPTESDHKVYIIKNAESMTSAAQNALLKVIEEPPESTYVFLLCDDADKILSTIKSRAQYVQMQVFSPEKIKDFLTSSAEHEELISSVSPERLDEAALASLGVIGGALELLDEKQLAETERTRDNVISLLNAIRTRGAFSQLYTALYAMPTSRPELRRTLEFSLLALRDAFAVRAGIDARLLFFKSREDAEEFATVNPKRLTKIFDIITSALDDIDKNVMINTLLTDVALAINQA